MKKNLCEEILGNFVLKKNFRLKYYNIIPRIDEGAQSRLKKKRIEREKPKRKRERKRVNASNKYNKRAEYYTEYIAASMPEIKFERRVGGYLSELWGGEAASFAAPMSAEVSRSSMAAAAARDPVSARDSRTASR